MRIPSSIKSWQSFALGLGGVLSAGGAFVTALGEGTAADIMPLLIAAGIFFNGFGNIVSRDAGKTSEQVGAA